MAIQVRRGNLFARIPDASGGEAFEDLVVFDSTRVRVERIISDCHASPEGFWYDQAWGEWVAILRGGAVLEIGEPEESLSLALGDWVFLPAHCRHRVASTLPGTLWLAVHGDGAE